MRVSVASALCVGFAQDMAPCVVATALMTEHLACECMVSEDIYVLFILVIVCVSIYTVCIELQLYCMQRVIQIVLYIYSAILHVSVLIYTACIEL